MNPAIRPWSCPLPDVHGWWHYLHWHQGAQCAQWQTDNVHECTIWVRGILQWVNANIKCVTQVQAVSLVCLDSTFSFFLMTSVLTILFSVAQRSNTLRYLLLLRAKLRVECGHPYSSGWCTPQPHARCFYVFVYSPIRRINKKHVNKEKPWITVGITNACHKKMTCIKNSWRRDAMKQNSAIKNTKIN